MTGPLTGINVLDMGTGGVGPWAPSLLGMMGANVIKLEAPSGDALRIIPPFVKGAPTAYLFCNMAKRHLVLDLKDKSNWPLTRRLLEEADVLLQNLRPGVMDRLGLGYDAVRQINPTIVYVECSAWGFEGGMRDLAGAAGLADAFGGLISLNGDLGDRPERLRYPYTDFNAASYNAAAALLGLYARARTGQSQRIQLSQAGATIAIEISRIAEYLATGRVPLPLGHVSAHSAPHQAFLCQDRHYLAVGVEKESQWEGLCRALGVEHLKKDPRFASNVARVSHREELATILEKTFMTKPARWWAIRLAKERVPCGHFYDFETLRNHAQVIENDFMPMVDIPGVGRLYTGGVPWQFSKTPATVGAAPLPGQHNSEIKQDGFGSPGSKPKLPSTSERVEASPLAGLKVVDASQGLCGPYLSLMMALSGAEVVKVEPPEGDYARYLAPQDDEGNSAVFTQLNRNKRSVVIDVTSEEGREQLKKMLRDADVFIEDWGPEQASSLGLGHEDIKPSNPKLVYCSLTPFGEKGPLKDLPGSELVVQAVSSVTRSLGDLDSPPVRVGADIANLNASLMAFQGVLAALLHREHSGDGQRVAVSQLGTLLCIWGALWMALADPDDWLGFYCNNETAPRSHGLRAKDREVQFGAPAGTREGGEEELLNLFRELGVREVIEDPIVTTANRNPAALARFLWDARSNVGLLEKYFSTMTADEVIKRTSKGGTVTVPVNNVAEVLAHPQTQTLRLVESMTSVGGKSIEVLGLPWKGSWKEVASTSPPDLTNHA